MICLRSDYLRYNGALAIGEWQSVKRPGHGGRFGLPEPDTRRYKAPSSNDYQRWIRDGSTEVSHHFTSVFSEEMTRRYERLSRFRKLGYAGLTYLYQSVTEIPQQLRANHHGNHVLTPS